MTTTTGSPAGAPSCARFRHAVLLELLPVISHADYREADIRLAIRALWLLVPAAATYVVLAFTAPTIALPCALVALVSYLLTDQIMLMVSKALTPYGEYDSALEIAAAGLAMSFAVAVGAWLTLAGAKVGYTAASFGLHLAICALATMMAPSQHVVIVRLTQQTDAQRLRTLRASLENCPASGCPACPWRQAPPQP